MKTGPIKRIENDFPQQPVIRHQANARERHRTHRFEPITPFFLWTFFQLFFLEFLHFFKSLIDHFNRSSH